MTFRLASRACRAVSATTIAMSWSYIFTSSDASTSSSMMIEPSRLRPGTSFAVYTATTPGICSAALVSMLSSFACARVACTGYT